MWRKHDPFTALENLAMYLSSKLRHFDHPASGCFTPNFPSWKEDICCLLACPPEKQMASVNQYTTKLFSYFACWLKICWLLKWVHYLLFSPGTNHCFVPENWGARYPWVPILGFCKIKQHFLKSPGHFCLSLLCNYKNNQKFFFACILWVWLHKLYTFINSTVCLRKNIFKRLWWS